MGFFEGFEKMAEEYAHERNFPGKRPRKKPLRECMKKSAVEDITVVAPRHLSPTLLRSAIGAGAGAAVGGVFGREIGEALSKIPPIPGSEASKLLSAFSPAGRKRVLEVVRALGRSRGALAGGGILGLAGAYYGSKPSFD